MNQKKNSQNIKHVLTYLIYGNSVMTNWMEFHKQLKSLLLRFFWQLYLFINLMITGI